MLFEPEVTIRRLFKCCSAGSTCSGCSFPSSAYLKPTTIKSTVPKRNDTTVYRCTFCTFDCTWKYDLKLHLKQKHGIHKK